MNTIFFLKIHKHGPSEPTQRPSLEKLSFSLKVWRKNLIANTQDGMAARACHWTQIVYYFLWGFHGNRARYTHLLLPWILARLWGDIKYLTMNVQSLIKVKWTSDIFVWDQIVLRYFNTNNTPGNATHTSICLTECEWGEYNAMWRK